MPRLNRLARVAFVASVMFAVSRVKGVSPRKHKITTKRDRSRGLVEHANIRLWAPLDRVLSVVWVTPNVHKIHHSRDSSETNSNYGDSSRTQGPLISNGWPVSSRPLKRVCV